MTRIELQIEHSYKNRFIGRHRVIAGQGITTIGSARDASIRLLGDNVGGMHASLEWNEKSWMLSDLGTGHGTWIQKKPVVCQKITESTMVQIGQHSIKLTPVVFQNDLFAADKTSSLEGNGELFHQIVIRRHGLLVENALLAATAPFQMQLGGEALSLPAPKSEQWVTTARDGVEIRQRLAKADVLNQTNKERFATVFDPSLKAPLVLAMGLIVFVAAVFFFLPREPKDTMVALKPEEQNRYTRMIYDAAKIKKQKAESQKLKQQIAAKLPDKGAPAKGSVAKPTGAAARVVNNIRSSGLQALIGKISARAAKNAMIIQAAGVAPDVAGAGVALGVGRTVAGAAPKELGNGTGGGTHKVGGVGTAGKGGGSGDYKGFGGMAAGNVGNATVGALDEESEVDGGLDKDVIARYIKTQLGQIRYCYERQLSASPDLYGKVLIKFTIGPTGSVVTQNIGTTSLNNAMVEGCILRRVAGWQFPTPKGGTQVMVSYPFLFKSTR